MPKQSIKSQAPSDEDMITIFCSGRIPKNRLLETNRFKIVIDLRGAIHFLYKDFGSPDFMKLAYIGKIESQITGKVRKIMVINPAVGTRIVLQRIFGQFSGEIF